MIIKKIILRNIKSFYPEEIIELENRVNIFVGPNGGGKSNLFEIVQGVISNILLKHITLQGNGSKNDINSPHKGKPYQIVFDNPDQGHFLPNLLDKHVKHLGQPQSFELHFLITTSDIEMVSLVLANRYKLNTFLSQKVANSEQIVQTLSGWQSSSSFEPLKNKILKTSVLPPHSMRIGIGSYADFPQEQHPLLNQFIEILQYVNVFHEISSVIPDLALSPLD